MNIPSSQSSISSSENIVKTNRRRLRVQDSFPDLSVNTNDDIITNDGNFTAKDKSDIIFCEIKKNATKVLMPIPRYRNCT